MGLFRWLLSGAGLAGALVLWSWLSADDTAPARASTNTQPGLPSPAGSSSDADRRMPATVAMTATAASTTPTAAPPAPLPALPFTPMGPAVPISVAIPQKVLVGEMGDLVVGVGANTDVSEIAFIAQFDGQVLQVRAGTQGNWAVDVGVNPHFTAEISGAEDRVQIRSTVSDQGAGLAGGGVATVQFQAIAPGTTFVLITDVVVRDSRGRSTMSELSASNLQVTVDSVPPPQPVSPRQSAPVAPEVRVAGDRERGD